MDVGYVDVELPKSLSFLNLKNNPCCRTQKGLYQMLESCLTNLKELNWEDPLVDETVNWEDDAELEEDTDGMSDNKQVYLEEDERYEKRLKNYPLIMSNLSSSTSNSTDIYGCWIGLGEVPRKVLGIYSRSRS